MTDHLVDAAMLTANAMKQLREESARNIAVMEQQQKLISDLQAEVSILKEYLRKAEHERDHYRVYAVEVTSKLTVIQDVIHEACTKAQHAAYAPQAVLPPKQPDNGADIETAIADAVQVEHKPVPKFLTKGRTVANGKEAVK